MKLTREESIDSAFVLSPEDLSALVAAFGQYAGTPTIRAVCRDHNTREFVNLDELLGYANLLGTEIVGLQIRCKASNPDREAVLLLNDGIVEPKESTQRNVWIAINGPDEQFQVVNQAINERLSAMKPWYSWVATTKGLNNVLIFLISVLASWLSYKIISKYGLFSEETRKLIAFCAWFGFLILFHKLRAALFPMGVFAINDGRKRHTTREWVRISVFIGFIVSLVSGWLITLIS